MIPIPFLAGRSVAVFGLGRSGLAAARALHAGGARVHAWDDSDAARTVADIEGIPLVDLGRADWSGVDMLVLSPGVPHRHPAPHPVVERARAAGSEVIGDVELLVRARPAATIVGITGTNGKSTTTALVGHILGSASLRVQVGGNLGVPALALAPLGADGIYVLELSSFQLELTPSLACRVAVLLNISPDHLERHRGMDGYVAAKRRIFAGPTGRGTAVVGVDDARARAVCEALRAEPGWRVVPVSAEAVWKGGVYVAGGTLYDQTADTRGGVMDIGAVPTLPGAHNRQNAAAAYAVARALGVPGERIAEAIASFPGLAHRQETCAIVDGVAYVNDSKATNGTAAARALACYEGVHWIAGGQAKEGGLGPVESELGRVRHAFLIGEAAPAFARVLEGRVPCTVCGTLERAVAEARARAVVDGRTWNGHARSVVLLSPACASFDQFRDFEHRGERFRELVQSLPGTHEGDTR